jgi:hypothetical protein
MTTTELIKLLKSIEFGASGRPREITFWFEGGPKVNTYSFKSLELSSTGDGVAGAEVSFNLTQKKIW